MVIVLGENTVSRGGTTRRDSDCTSTVVMNLRLVIENFMKVGNIDSQPSTLIC